LNPENTALLVIDVHMANAWNAGSAVLLEQGSFEFSNQQIADAELWRLFAKY